MHSLNLSFGEVQRFVTDLKRAKAFYVDVLGLKLVSESNTYLVFDVSGTEFIVIGGAHRGQCHATYGKECGTVLCLKSDDIERDFEILKERGVRFFSEVNEVEVGKFVAFQDPDGNLLELISK